jgi:hypothetical protein
VGSVSDYVRVVVRKFGVRMYKCRVCGREYYTRSGVRQHVKRKHLGSTNL